MLVRELITKIGFSLDEKPIQKAESSISGLKTAVLSIGAAFSGITATLFGLAKSAANHGDQVNKAAQKTGLSVEEYQKLSYAAELADVSNEQLGVGLTILSKKMQDAATGGKAGTESFQKVGISAKNSHGQLKSASEVVQEMADKFQKMPDGAKKTALAVEVFGKSGASLIPLLNGGGNAIKEIGEELNAFNGIMGKDATQASEEFNDAFTRVGRFISSIKNAIGIELVPVIKDVLDRILSWAKANKELIKVKIAEAVETLRNVLKRLLVEGEKVLKWTKSFIDAMGGVEKALGLVVAGFKIFIGLQILSSVNTAIKGFRALGIAIGIFKAVALWEIYAVIAVIALVAGFIYLIYEDVLAWLDGRPNVFGAFYQWVSEVGAWIADGFKAIIDFVMDAWLVFQTDFLPVIKAFGAGMAAGFSKGYEAVKSFVGVLISFGSKILEITGIGATWRASWNLLLPILEKVGSVLSSIGKAAAAISFDMLKQLVTNPIDAIRNRAEDIKANKATGSLDSNPFLGVDPASISNLSKAPPVGGFGGGPVANNTNNQSNQFAINQKIEVNVQSSADPATIGDQIRQSTRDEMDRSLRSAASAIAAGTLS